MFLMSTGHDCLSDSSGRRETMHQFIGAGRSALLVNSPLCCVTYGRRLKLWRNNKERKLGRELTIREAYKQSHCRKGSRPLDKDLSCSNSLILDVDSEGDAQEENLVWVDARAEETWVKYEGFLEEKYGKERNKHPKFDKDLWSRAEGKHKGKGYGLGNDSDPCVHRREDPEIEKLNLVIKELVKEKDEEKERFNGIIAGLLADKEKDKVDKDALLDRMSQIEAMLTATVRK
ncbi:uncharacterized protein LOC110909152 isoform X4 [Helianthus annuus]|uniref:uncharacterized protein LOC110909152 isoform X4 n=1 Tax=Helianthus annuus TaxID=4232 RepID=UPI000B8EFAEE|nr:uncharacterized protein LOC110909152 isoform X4 [Helianthus annuus]